MLQDYHHKRPNQRGFTIIELLVVIVVIGILATITIVAYNGFQSRATLAKKQSEVTIVQKSFELYRNDAGGGAYFKGQSPPSQILADIGLPQSLRAQIYMPQNRSDCQDPNMTDKKKYCLAVSSWSASNGNPSGSLYEFVYWNDQTGRWQGGTGKIQRGDSTSEYTSSNDRNRDGTPDFGTGPYPYSEAQ